MAILPAARRLYRERNEGGAGLVPRLVNPGVAVGAGDGEAELGRALKDASVLLRPVAEGYQANQIAAVDDELLRVNREFAQWQTEYEQTHQGRDAVNAAEDFAARHDELKAEAMKRLNGNALEKFAGLLESRLDDQGLQAVKAGLGYGARQTQAWKQSQWEGQLAEYELFVQNNAANAEAIARERANLLGSWQAKNPGMDATAFAAKIDENTARKRFETLLLQEDFAGAQAVIDGSTWNMGLPGGTASGGEASGGGASGNGAGGGAGGGAASQGGAGGRDPRLYRGGQICEDLNNPLNLKKPGAAGSGRESFQFFATPEDGYRGARAQLLRYKKRGLVTPKQIISTWAPPNENKTAEYIAFVCQKLGVSPDTKIDVANDDTAAALLQAMGAREGRLGTRYTAAQIKQALGENGGRADIVKLDPLPGGAGSRGALPQGAGEGAGPGIAGGEGSTRNIGQGGGPSAEGGEGSTRNINQQAGEGMQAGPGIASGGEGSTRNIYPGDLFLAQAQQRLNAAREARARREEAEAHKLDWQTRQSVDDWLAQAARGVVVPLSVSEADIARAYGDRAGQMLSRVAVMGAYAVDINALADMNPEQQQALLQARMPAPGSEYYAEKVAGHDQLAAALRQDQQARAQDACAYAIQHDESTSAARQAFQQQPSAETFSAYAQALGAARLRLGLPGDNLLAKDDAQALAAAIEQSPNPAQTLRQYEGMSGSLWPRLNQEIAGKLSDFTLALSAGVPDDSVALLMAARANPKFSEQTLEMLSDSRRSAKDIRDRLDSEIKDNLQDFTASMVAAGCASQADGIHKMTAQLALQFMALRHMDEDDAAKLAAQHMVGRYNYRQSPTGITWRAPKQYNPDDLQWGVNHFLEHVPLDSLNLEWVKGADKKMSAENFRKILRRQTDWIINPDESGLWFAVNGKRIYNHDGSPLELKFSHALKLKHWNKPSNNFNPDDLEL